MEQCNNCVVLFPRQFAGLGLMWPVVVLWRESPAPRNGEGMGRGLEGGSYPSYPTTHNVVSTRIGATSLPAATTLYFTLHTLCWPLKGGFKFEDTD